MERFFFDGLQIPLESLYNVYMYDPKSNIMGKNRRKVAVFTALIITLVIAAILGCSAYVTAAANGEIVGALDSHDDIFTKEEIEAYREIDPECILVLGASVLSDGTPSDMLRDRLDAGIALYRAGAAPKLLLSGDNGQVEYNEVAAMLEYALAAGVPEEDVFLDHAGFSTYESVYRAKAVFRVDRMLVVTQRYHLYRALHGCRAMGIEALGAGADQQKYAGREMRELREVLARDKDLVKWGIRPDPTFLGDPIAITGDGTGTH